MKTFKFALMGAVAATSIFAGVAQAGNTHFTSHHLVDKKPYEEYADQLTASKKLTLRNYLEYEQREPCQFYQPVPEGFVQNGCTIIPERLVTKAPVQVPVETTTMVIGNVITDYEVHFAYDSAEIEPAAGDTLRQVASDINKYDPRDVTVAGFADAAGSADYNVKLSEKRAEAVSEALTERGVTNRVIDKKAYGENNLAVKTDDGVALRENRRVVVEFRK